MESGKEMTLRSARRSMSLLEYRNRLRDMFAQALPVCMNGITPRKNDCFTEPEYVYGIVQNIPKIVNGMGLNGLRLGACFIHGSPFAAFPGGDNKKSCELGDLLVLYREIRQDKECFNSVLFQYKKADHDSIDQKQYMLYSQWPQFNMGKKRNTNREQYDVRPKSIHQGALYQFIHTCGGLRFTVAEPHATVIDDMKDVRKGMPFEEYLADFLIWQTGRAISSYAKHPGEKKTDQWSHLIWDIVQKTMRANGKQPRQFGDFFNEMLGQQLLQPIDTTQNRDVDDVDAEGACSILFISKDTDKEAIAPAFVV